MNCIGSITSKIQRSLSIHGILGTIKLCIDKTIKYILYLTPSQRRDRIITKERDLAFDREWGVDTCGSLVPNKSEVVGSNWIYGIKYQGCNSTALYEVLSELPIIYEHFTFVDFGSGKGRAILLASRFPFRRIIGVEYSEQLCEIARHNFSCFPKTEKKCNKIEIVCTDAVKFSIPKDPLVVFLFNPFGKPIMKEVVKNIFTSFRQNPRRIIVLYFNAVFADVWRNASFMEEIRTSKWITIFDTHVRKIGHFT